MSGVRRDRRAPLRHARQIRHHAPVRGHARLRDHRPGRAAGWALPSTSSGYPACSCQVTAKTARSQATSAAPTDRPHISQTRVLPKVSPENDQRVRIMTRNPREPCGEPKHAARPTGCGAGCLHDTLGDRESCRAWPWHRLDCPERLRRRDRDRLGHLTSNMSHIRRLCRATDLGHKGSRNKMAHPALTCQYPQGRGVKLTGKMTCDEDPLGADARRYGRHKNFSGARGRPDDDS